LRFSLNKVLQIILQRETS